MTVTSKVASVFLSHTEDDAELARDIARRLKLAGLEPVSAARSDRGYKSRELLRRQIAESEAVFILATPAALTSDWLLYENGMAEGLEKRVFVITAGVRQKQLPAPMQSRTIVAFDRLDATIENLPDRLNNDRE
jgi:hypothetical protein